MVIAKSLKFTDCWPQAFVVYITWVQHAISNADQAHSSAGCSLHHVFETCCNVLYERVEIEIRRSVWQHR
jgi:hypothetical protein